MNKDKNKENYIKVLQALKKAQKDFKVGDEMYLYLHEESGLDKIDFFEIRDLLVSMEQDELIKIIKYPNLSVLLYDRNFTADPLPEMFSTAFRNRPARNYFIIRIYPMFNLIFNYFCVPLYLLAAIPQTSESRKKYKVPIKLLELLVSAQKVDGFTLAESFIKVRNSKTYKKTPITQKIYDNDKNKYNEQIRNRLKTVIKCLKPFGYTVQFRDSVAKLIEIQQ